MAGENYIAKQDTLLDVQSKIGVTTDTGGTTTAGTVYAKLNRVITSIKHKSFKHLQTLVPMFQTDYTVLSVSGLGEFYGIYGTPTQAKVIIDGIEFSVNGNQDVFGWFVPNLTNGLTRIQYPSNTYYPDRINSLPFKNSLVVKVSTTNYTNGGYIDLSYSLDE